MLFCLLVVQPQSVANDVDACHAVAVLTPAGTAAAVPAVDFATAGYPAPSNITAATAMQMH
jgi:hypothetical protein